MSIRDELLESLGVSAPASPWVKDNGWGFDFTRGGKWHFVCAGKSLCGKISLPGGTDLAPLVGQFPDRIKSCCRDCVVELRTANRQPELFARAA